MPNHGSEQSTGGVYLLFAHEAYYPAHGQEINTSLVAAASLLHPRVRQPDGTRIHERLTHSRRPGEIVPLATLTHELDGGTLWLQVGDWAAVTADLLKLIHDRGCDALSLGLPPIARALVCSGPRSGSVSTIRRPRATGSSGPPTGLRSWSKSASSWPGRKLGVPCGRETCLCPTPTRRGWCRATTSRAACRERDPQEGEQLRRHGGDERGVLIRYERVDQYVQDMTGFRCGHPSLQDHFPPLGDVAEKKVGRVSTDCAPVQTAPTERFSRSAAMAGAAKL